MTRGENAAAGAAERWALGVGDVHTTLRTSAGEIVPPVNSPWTDIYMLGMRLAESGDETIEVVQSCDLGTETVGHFKPDGFKPTTHEGW